MDEPYLVMRDMETGEVIYEGRGTLEIVGYSTHTTGVESFKNKEMIMWAYAEIQTWAVTESVRFGETWRTYTHLTGAWVEIAETANIHPRAILGTSSSIHPRTTIGSGTTIGDFVAIGEGSRIGYGTRIGSDTSIGSGTTIAPACRLAVRFRSTKTTGGSRLVPRGPGVNP